jgi:hypothetical protein
VFLRLPAFVDWLGTLQTVAMLETKKASRVCGIGSLLHWMPMWLQSPCSRFVYHTHCLCKNMQLYCSTNLWNEDFVCVFGALPYLNSLFPIDTIIYHRNYIRVYQLAVFAEHSYAVDEASQIALYSLGTNIQNTGHGLYGLHATDSK